MFVSRQMRARLIKRKLGVTLSILFVAGITIAWFLNAQAGIAAWAPPTIQMLTSSSGAGIECAVADNKVYCWGGTNTFGQLGTGDNTTVSYIPRQINDPNGVLVGKTITSIAVARTGTVCVVASNVPYCWGRGNFGALGDNTTSDRYYPSAVTTSGVLSGKTITFMGAGDGHVCVIASGAAYCWGANGQGRLGDGSTTQRNTPVAVSTSGVLSGKTVTSISGVSAATCAVASGAAYCWGDDTNGYLGNDSSYTQSTTPVAVDTSGVMSGKTITGIASGNNHTCALASDSTAFCWGQGPSGQLGNNATPVDSPVPVQVYAAGAISGKTLTKISAGNGRGCLIDTNGDGYCWGTGPVGDGSGGTKLVPTKVTGASTLNGMKMVQIVPGASGICFLNSVNRVFCNGTSGSILGNNTSGTSNAPVMVLFTSTFNAANYRLYANANSATPGSPLAGINTAATLSSAGQAFRVRMGIKTTPTIGRITSGSTNSCGVSDGKAYCWGRNSEGELGNNSTTQSTVPVAVDTSGVLSGKTILAISSGTYHTCVIASDNQAYCWGQNAYGQLGNNSTTESHVPVAVDTSGVLSGKSIRTISLGSTHTCVIASDNQAYCWGQNTNGQLGNNSTTESHVPVAVDTSGVLSGKTVLAVYSSPSNSAAHACAIASDNQAYCWGLNTNGQLGNNSTTQSLVPVAVNTAGVLSGKTVLTISVGNAHACAIASDKLAYCWGYDGNGQLGNNSTTQSTVPVAVSTAGVLTGKTIQSISTGDNTICAIASDNQAYCWGWNGNGQLGNNSTTQSLVAVATVTDGYVPGAEINPSDNTYKLQFAQKTAGSCSAQTGFADVGAATAIAFNTNAGVSSGAAITSNANDPVPTTDSVAQTYISASGAFTNSSIITGGKTGLWDMSLKDNSNTYSTSYCLRLSYGDGTAIEGVVQYPEIQTVAKQSAEAAPFRFYKNADSLTPGSPLGITDQEAALTSPNQAFRLRTGLLGISQFTSKVSSGGTHTCAIASGNKAYCWGSSTYGQVGNNSTSQSLVPVAVDTSGVLSGKTILSIATATYHTCAVASDNQAYCWGLNNNGRLGNNSTTQSLVPVAVDTSGVLSGKTILSIATGDSHACVVASDNQAYCWGAGGNGRLGNNSTSQSLVPVAVNTAGVLSGKTILSISGGTSHTCVVASDNQAYCWGAGSNGQLGNNSTSQSLVPVAVDTSGVLSGKTILSISAGSYYTCVVASDIKAYCWGGGASGRLGNNSSSDSLVPVAVNTAGVLSGKTILSISAGSFHTCAVASDNQAYCWGSGLNGQLGNNSYSQSLVPVAVDTSGVLSGKTILSISAGGNHTCTVASDNQAYCWGNGTDGQLGDTTLLQRAFPRQTIIYKLRERIGVAGRTLRLLTLGASHTCAVASDNQAYCWGAGSAGQLGDNSASDSLLSVAVDTSGVLSGKTILSISTRNAHTCVVASDSQAYCWGNGGNGRLGNNAASQSNVPVAVDTSGVLSGKTILSISTGSNHTCAVASDNLAYCWGSGSSGQLGNNSTSQSLVPVAVNTAGVLSGKTILSISAGGSHTCAVASDNLAYCWGSDSGGQLGNNSNTQSLVPVAVNTAGVLSGKTILSISTGDTHTCAVASDSKAYCWGSGSSGRLGNNSTSQSLVPVAVNTAGVLSGKNILSISGGTSHTCVVASDNQAYCWGEGASGRLGNNSTSQSLVPVAVNTAGVLSGKTILSISTGDTYTCALASDSKAYCWGYNNYGQFGDGIAQSSLVPTAGYAISFSSMSQSISASANAYTLQYAVKSALTCSAQTTGFADVTGATPIAFNTNASVTTGTAISTTANDPLGSTQTTAQTYISAPGIFTNTNAISFGTMGLWDFSLKDNGAPYNTTYCFRIAYSDGTPLTTNQVLPELRTTLGSLSVGFIDNLDGPLSNPTINFNPTTIKTSIQTVTGSFGSSSQKLRVYNDLATNGWSASIAATSGSTALWDRTDNLAKYDFNDATGGVDGGDGDLLGGALTLSPNTGTIGSPSGCGTTGLSLGSLATFSEGVTDSITLFSASNTAVMGCNYDLTNMGLSQVIPAVQESGSYTLDMTITVVAL